MRHISETLECVDTVDLKIPCKSEYVRTVRWLIAEVADAASLSCEAVEEVQIAASEAVSNIVRHAYGPGKTPQPIFLRLCRWPGELAIEIIDRGIGFRVPEPDPDQLPDVSREGGLGIVLIRALMDRVEYKSRPNLGTRILMTKKLSPAARNDQAQDKMRVAADGGIASSSARRKGGRRAGA